VVAPNLNELAHRVGLQLQGVFQFKWGAGHGSRIGGVMITLIIAYAAIAIFMPPSDIKGMTLIALLVVGVVYLIGSWIVAAFAPQSNLEGPQYVAWFTAAQGAKGLPNGTTAPVISEAEYRAIEQQKHTDESTADKGDARA